MLILSRNRSQEIIIGENAEIRVTVLSVSENQVRLGFTAQKTCLFTGLKFIKK